MSAAADLLVLGAGPAGAEAAIAARELGLSVTVVDAAEAAGGQVYRAPRPGLAQAADGDAARGDDLRRRLAASGARLALGHRVWLAERGFRLHALGPNGPATFDGRSLIVAAGALERHLPVPGWTLPGVIGLAAATILLKSEGALPGRRVVVAGSGPFLLQVAAKVVAAGGTVAAVVDANRRRAWIAATPWLAGRPGLLARGAGWLATLARHRVPILSGHAIRRIEGSEAVERVAVGPVDADWRPVSGDERIITADAVAYGFGLMPATEVTRLLGAEHAYDEKFGGWCVTTDADQATSVPGLFACGDSAGVTGAGAAPLAGRLAAFAAARHLGRLDAAAFAERARPLRAMLARSARFGTAMTVLAMPRPGAIDLVTPDTLVCRCEGVTRATLDAAIAAGGRDLNDLKSATRCGMGPCGGRVCGEAAAMLIASATGLPRAAIGQATARPPLFPVPLDDLAGAFAYDDLPIPEPAPL